MSSIQKKPTSPASTRAYYDQGADSSPSPSPSPSPSWRNKHNGSFPPLPLLIHNNNKLEESDEDLFTVPDVEAAGPPQLPLLSSLDSTNPSNTANRRRGSNPVDREHRKLKRLLRNRVSAQQARERKKVYVNELESRAKELQDMNMTLDEKISTLVNENAMLRKVLMNTRPKVDES